MSSENHPTRSLQLKILPIIVALIAAGALVFKGCQEGPFGRKQIVALNAQEEAALGAQAFREVLRDAEVVRDGPIVEAVQRIGRRLAQASQDPDVLRAVAQPPQEFEWEFRVVRSDQVNAFCLPGGKVVVYTGILRVAQTEAGLATVMGHEIAHALAHHGAERMAQHQLLQLGQQAAAASLGDMDPQSRDQILAAIGVGSKFGILLPFSRSHESEADHMGLLLMAAAGYDPREASRFWLRMEEMAGGGKQPEFMSTHPSHDTRSRDLQGWLSEALPLYEKSGKQRGERPLPRP